MNFGDMKQIDLGRWRRLAGFYSVVERTARKAVEISGCDLYPGLPLIRHPPHTQQHKPFTNFSGVLFTLTHTHLLLTIRCIPFQSGGGTSPPEIQFATRGGGRGGGGRDGGKRTLLDYITSLHHYIITSLHRGRYFKLLHHGRYSSPPFFLAPARLRTGCHPPYRNLVRSRITLCRCSSYCGSLSTHRR